MYVVEVSNKFGTVERKCRSKVTATRIATITAIADYVYIKSREHSGEQKRFDVETVRVYSTTNEELIEVTKHGDNDYSIYFGPGDFSLRGSFLDIIKAYTEYKEVQ